jgi:hypothetical protein
MIIKNGDTKGVTGGKTGTSGGLFGNSAVGNWWQKLATAAVSSSSSHFELLFSFPYSR